MAKTDIFAFGRSDLNGFLFAEIGQETNGMPLTVLSGFARLGADPWAEAARLGRLSTQAAIESLARAIAALPASLGSSVDATAIATRLVALLPNAAPAAAPQAVPHGRAVRMLAAALIATGICGVVLSLSMQRPPAPIASPVDPAH